MSESPQLPMNIIDLPVITAGEYDVLEKLIVAVDGEMGRMPTSNEYAEGTGERAKYLEHLKSLEAKKLIGRTAKNWNTGYLRDLAREALRRRRPWKSFSNQFPQGIAEDGGTKYKKQLVSVDDKAHVLSLGRNNVKLGDIITKKKHRGHKMVAVTFEEGRTCPPSCSEIRKICYGGGMPYAKRILWEGQKTIDAIVAAINEAARKGLIMVRFHTLGDFPTLLYAFSIWLTVLLNPNVTAFGFTHHWPETLIGGFLRWAAEKFWDTFAIRTSYKYGSREHILTRSAVIVESREQAAEMQKLGGVLCPEQSDKIDRKTGETKSKTESCATCGFCWSSQRPVIFMHHSVLAEEGKAKKLADELQKMMKETTE